MSDIYPSNSNKSKEEQQKQEEPREKLQPVAKGAKLKKRSEFGKFARNFIAEDSDKVGGYLFKDVFVPIVKNTIQQLVTKGIDYVLYGESAGKSTSSTPKISYGGFWNGGGSSSAPSQPKQSGFTFDDIVLTTRKEAEQVRTMLYEMIERYHRATVGDYYDLCQITAPYTANKYGWTDIGECPVVRCREGFILKLPRAIPLENH